MAKEDGDNFVSVMDNSGETIQLSVSFPFLEESARAKTVFLLQVDNFESYQILENFKKYIPLMGKKMEFKVHYKIYKNMVLNDEGSRSDEDPSSMSDILFVDQDFYFVLKDNSFEKSRSLLMESLKQMCIHFADEEIFFKYMNEVRNRCFEGPNSDGNFVPVGHFMGCTQGIYGSMIKGKNNKFDEEMNICIDTDGPMAEMLLNDNHELSEYYSLNYTPLIFINHHLYKGNLQDTLHLVEALCMAFEDPPKECLELDIFHDYQNFSGSSLISFVGIWTLYFGSFFLVVVFVFYFFYKRKLQNNMSGEISDKVNDMLIKHYGVNQVAGYTSGVKISQSQGLTEHEKKIAQENSI